jgi:hypothetical protein
MIHVTKEPLVEEYSVAAQVLQKGVTHEFYKIALQESVENSVTK